MLIWSRREIENYLCYPEALLAYARGGERDDMFGRVEAQRRRTQMEECVRELYGEVVEKLDAIVEVASQAAPAADRDIM
ncbi:MAG: hypothetical protein K6T75_03520 [Acetobacteraceae bacterium]|nr:hypothetical protein [Acetobacteraceae bacterium]